MFKIGQKVVYKNTNTPFGGTPFGIEKGRVYKINGIKYCHNCGSEFLQLLGVDSFSKKHCSDCDCLTPYSNIFHSWRFEPLKYDLIPNKQLCSFDVEEKIDSDIIPTVLKAEGEKLS